MGPFPSSRPASHHTLFLAPENKDLAQSSVLTVPDVGFFTSCWPEKMVSGVSQLSERLFVAPFPPHTGYRGPGREEPLLVQRCRSGSGHALLLPAGQGPLQPSVVQQNWRHHTLPEAGAALA